jgi:uncharacterized protein
MTESVLTVLSVRGDAQLEVPPDRATLNCSVRADDRDKAAVLRLVSARLDAVLADLRDLGGQPRAAADDRRPLTWLAHSATSRVETQWDHQREREIKTGRVVASVALRIEVRDFALMDRLGSLLARHDATEVSHVDWGVDADNPGWPEVRAAAIHAAIEKGRDYARALGGALQRIEHVADVGLLGGSDRHSAGVSYVQAASMSRGSRGEADAPSLDPEPQILHAEIEAQFSASVRELT